MFKLLRQPVFSVSNMLKNFGIVNPNILRNLSYHFCYSELVNFTRQVSDTFLQTPTPKTAA